MGGGFGRAVKGERELQENRAELACTVETVEAGADVALVFGGGGGFVGEALPKFCGEEERGVGGNAFEPGGGMVRADGLIERGVDFDGVKKLGEERGFVKTFRAA